MTSEKQCVMVVGATGFIGRRIAGALIAAGFDVLPAARNSKSAKRRFPKSTVLHCDLARDSQSDWEARLTGVDAVVNAAGLLDSGHGESLKSVHIDGPKHLITACEAKSSLRFIHLSAISATGQAGTEYADTKLATEELLRKSALDWTILRPSLVYGAGSYGGTSLLRGLAGFPVVTPIPGQGDFLFQPIHVDDLAALVVRCLREAVAVKTVLEPIGPERRTLKQIVCDTRQWLDLPKQPVLHVPMGPVKAVSFLLGRIFGGPFSPTAIRQMEYGNIGDYDAYQESGGTPARTMAQAFAASPSSVQDRWHARLYFLRPGLRAALVFLWVASAMVGLFFGQSESEVVARKIGMAGAGEILRYGFSVIDLLLAGGMFVRRYVRPVLFLQFLTVLGYTLGLGILMPELWVDLYGGLIKNIPILVAILVLMALEDDK